MNSAKLINLGKYLAATASVAIASTLISLPASAQVSSRPGIFNEPLYNRNAQLPNASQPDQAPGLPASPTHPTPDVTPYPDQSPDRPQFPSDSAPGGTPFPGSLTPDSTPAPERTAPAPLVPELYPDLTDPNNGSGYDPLGPDRR